MTFKLRYDGLIVTVLQGEGVKIRTIIPKGVMGHNPILPYHYNMEKAKQLLIEAGYPDGFELELKCLNFSPWIGIAIKLKQDFMRIGIRLKVTLMTVPELIEAWLSRNTQLFLWEWGIDYPDPDLSAKAFAHCDSLDEDASVKLAAWRFSYVNLETSSNFTSGINFCSSIPFLSKHLDLKNKA